MNTPKLLHAEPQQGDLDARILQAEQRLVARQENIQRRLAAAGQRLQRALNPGRLLWPLGATLAVGGLGWLLRGRRSAAVAPFVATPPGHEAVAGAGGVPWLQVAGSMWPLLPRSWRRRISPATFNLVLNAGLPLARSLLRPHHPALADARPVAAAQLAGDWLEVAWLPRRRAASGGAGGTGSVPRWQHTLRDDGGMALQRTRLQPDGSVQETVLHASPLPGSGGARWRVSEGPALRAALSLAGHEEVVLYVDDEPGTLLLGSPGRERLRLLSRRPGLAPQHVQAVLALARERGFEVGRMQFAQAA
jgi:lipocalin